MSEPLADIEWEFREEKDKPLWAWVAGIIDGEGHIQLITLKRKYGYDRLELAVSMTHKPSIEKLKEITHVGCVSIRRRALGYKTQWRWSCVGPTAAKILTLCLPWLVTKKEQALIAIEYAGVKKLCHAGVPPPASLLAKRSALINKMRSLNKTKRTMDDMAVKPKIMGESLVLDG